VQPATTAARRLNAGAATMTTPMAMLTPQISSRPAQQIAQDIDSYEVRAAISAMRLAPVVCVCALQVVCSSY
jgi:hypothetical protein